MTRSIVCERSVCLHTQKETDKPQIQKAGSRDAGIGRDKVQEVSMKQTVLDANRSQVIITALKNVPLVQNAINSLFWGWGAYIYIFTPMKLRWTTISFELKYSFQEGGKRLATFRNLMKHGNISMIIKFTTCKGSECYKTYKVIFQDCKINPVAVRKWRIILDNLHKNYIGISMLVWAF